MVVSLGPGKFYGSSLPRPRIYTDVKFNTDRVDPPVPVMDPLLSWAEEAHWSMGGLSFKRLRLQGRIEGNVNKLRKQREKQAKVRAVHSPKPPITVTGLVRLNGKGIKKEMVRSGSESPPGPRITKRRTFIDNPPITVTGPVRVNGKGSKKEMARSGSGSRSGPDLSPPAAAAPRITKRRRFIDNFDEESEEEEEESPAVEIEKTKKWKRKLAPEFEKVADQTPIGVRTRRRGVNAGDSVLKIVEELNKENSLEKKVKAAKQSKNGGESKIRSSPVNSVRTSPRLAKKT